MLMCVSVFSDRMEMETSILEFKMAKTFIIR